MEKTDAAKASRSGYEKTMKLRHSTEAKVLPLPEGWTCGHPWGPHDRRDAQRPLCGRHSEVVEVLHCGDEHS
jgi:hypothetical protein